MKCLGDQWMYTENQMVWKHSHISNPPCPASELYKEPQLNWGTGRSFALHVYYQIRGEIIHLFITKCLCSCLAASHGLFTGCSFKPFCWGTDSRLKNPEWRLGRTAAHPQLLLRTMDGLTQLETPTQLPKDLEGTALQGYNKGHPPGTKVSQLGAPAALTGDMNTLSCYRSQLYCALEQADITHSHLTNSSPASPVVEEPFLL